MKHAFTAAIAGVGLLTGLGAATACERKMNNATAPTQMKLAAETNAPKDVTPHPTKSKTEAQGAKNTPKTPDNGAGNSNAQQPKKPNG